MKLTKDTLIEGKIVPKGTSISIKEEDSKAQDKEDSAQYKKFMQDFKDGNMKDSHGNTVTSEKQAHMIANAKSEADDKKPESKKTKEAVEVLAKYLVKDYMGNEKILTFYDKNGIISARLMTKDRTPLALTNLGLSREQADGLTVWAEDEEWEEIEDFIIDQSNMKSIRAIK